MLSTTLQEDKAALRGNPSYVWRFGQDRRLALVDAHVPLAGKRILDIGCGLGMYVRRFRDFSSDVWGVDVEFERVKVGSRSLPNLAVARGENLPFTDNSFDFVFLHEVLEHVDDDAQTVREACRVVRPGGHVVIYVPNRLYFFETHGFYLGKKFVFRLLPFINWFPDPIRRLFVPHVRAYLTEDLRRLWRGLPARWQHHGYVFPGFDNVVARSPRLGGALRRVCYLAERMPLRVFGLSHFLVVQKTGVV